MTMHCTTFVLIQRQRSSLTFEIDATVYQCTMGLSPLKSCIKEIEQNAFLCSHFLEISLFQTKYLENILYSVSLLIYIWGLVEHGHMQKNNFQKNQLQFQPAAGRMWKRLWDELNVICKNWLQIFYDDLANENSWKIFGKYLHNERGLG